MRIISMILMFWGLICGAVHAEEPRVTYSTGGMIRLPNTQLPSDAGNAMFEGWFKTSYRLHSAGDNDLIFSLRFKGLADIAGHVFNNSIAFGLEIAYKMPLGKSGGALTFKLRQDWQRRVDGVERRGVRGFLDYFYINYKTSQTDTQLLGLDRRARVLKVYSTLTFPETLVPRDRNLTLQGGADYSIILDIPRSSLRLAPYVGLHMAWDMESFSYNNKAQPSAGFRLKYPLPGGDFHLGMRYQGDYRWQSGLFEHGPSVFAGWYSSF